MGLNPSEVADFYRLVAGWFTKTADSLDAAVGVAGGPVASGTDLDRDAPETLTALRHSYVVSVLFFAMHDAQRDDVPLVECLWSKRAELAAEVAVSSCKKLAVKLDALDELLVQSPPNVVAGGDR